MIQSWKTPNLNIDPGYRIWYRHKYETEFLFCNIVNCYLTSMGLRADFGLSRLLVILLVTYSVRPTHTCKLFHAPTHAHASLSFPLTRTLLCPRPVSMASRLSLYHPVREHNSLGCNAPPRKTWQILIREPVSRDLLFWALLRGWLGHSVTSLCEQDFLGLFWKA